ncbi:MAG: hypothetical protein BWK76_13525 [Desulfobulbaceae bacterium A2]|nr:MAG: hypothetical protein BWK76_13525 [Desulfobulbaceae bacterium A2]
MNDTTLDQILARRDEAGGDIINVDEETVKLVIFELGGQFFAFHGSCIREILASTTVYFVPGCPASLEGVINVRGDIASVIRLHEMLHLRDSGNDTASSILLGEGGGMNSGIRVDRVVDVIDAAPSSIQPPPATLPEALRALVLGVLRIRDMTVTVLDLNKIFLDYARGLG